MSKIATIINKNNHYKIGTPEGQKYFCAETPEHEVSDEIGKYLTGIIDEKNNPVFTLSDVVESIKTPEKSESVVKKVVKKAVDTTQTEETPKG